MLAAFCFISLIHLNKKNTFSGYAYIWTAVICIIYGATDEVHQYFVPNRSSEIQDWIADAAGVLIMLLLIRYYMKNKFKIFRSENLVGT